MAALEIIGFDISNWVRAARIACEEKGVDYTLTTNGMNEFSDMKGASHLALHPFGRIPAMRHGDIVLFETSAICRYVDAVFDGPRLVPEDPIEAARMEQWVSAMVDYVSRSIMGRCVVQYVLPQFTGKPIDRATIDGAIPDIRNHLAILNRALAHGPFLHGNRPSIDDCILMPMVDALVAVAPEGSGLLAEAPNVARQRAAFQGRPSYHSTIPEMFRKAA
jgi:glutathione S-transferase